MTASTPMLVTFVVYIAAMVLIGLIAYMRTKNLSDCPACPKAGSPSA